MDSVNDKSQESFHMHIQEIVPGLTESGGSILALGLCVFYLESLNSFRAESSEIANGVEFFLDALLQVSFFAL